MITVLLGGARSGKSALAEELGRRHGGPVVVVATCPRIPGDPELALRIERHRAQRPDSWTTVEEEVDLAGAVVAADDRFTVVDCLTLWVNNLLHHGHDDTAVLDASERALAAATARRGDTVVVTNEVGLGIVPANDLARSYRDLLGGVNRQWVAAADRALFLVAGRALPLHDPLDLLR